MTTDEKDEIQTWKARIAAIEDELQDLDLRRKCLEDRLDKANAALAFITGEEKKGSAVSQLNKSLGSLLEAQVHRVGLSDDLTVADQIREEIRRFESTFTLEALLDGIKAAGKEIKPNSVSGFLARMVKRGKVRIVRRKKGRKGAIYKFVA